MPNVLAPTGNRLLDTLPHVAFHTIAEDLFPVDLTYRQVISERDEPTQHAYFPTSGMFSAVLFDSLGNQVEVGLIGREGFIGASILLTAKQTPFRFVIQGSGRSLRLPAASLLTASNAVPEFQAVLLRFIHTFTVQLASTVLANSAYLVEQRLARWILMSHDRMETASFPMTHEFMATMLGVRRAGVTDAIHSLEARGVIRARRGNVQVLNRIGLQDLASDSYGHAEREYKRLICP